MKALGADLAKVKIHQSPSKNKKGTPTLEFPDSSDLLARVIEILEAKSDLKLREYDWANGRIKKQFFDQVANKVSDFAITKTLFAFLYFGFFEKTKDLPLWKLAERLKVAIQESPFQPSDFVADLVQVLQTQEDKDHQTWKKNLDLFGKRFPNLKDGYLVPNPKKPKKPQPPKVEQVEEAPPEAPQTVPVEPEAPEATQTPPEEEPEEPETLETDPKAPKDAKVLLDELDKMLYAIEDRVGGVVRGRPGFYLHGRPGTGKTYTVRKVLKKAQKELGKKWIYKKGGITQGGILETMHDFQDEIIVLDDLRTIFDDKKAVQYLMAALDRQEGKALELSYTRQGQKPVKIHFTGSFVCISNLSIPPKGVLEAFKSRVRTLEHDPSDDMLIALAKHRICKNGYSRLKMSKEETDEIIDCVVTMQKELSSDTLKMRVDLRTFFEHAFPDYCDWKNGFTKLHWKDLVRITLLESARGNVEHPVKEPRRDQIARDTRIAIELDKEAKANKWNRERKRAEWVKRASKEATSGKEPLKQFYRYLEHPEKAQ